MKNIDFGRVKCPHCGESFFRVLSYITTAIYFPPVYKNGVNINPDGNVTTVYCKCLNCERDFYFKEKLGEIWYPEQLNEGGYESEDKD